MRCVYYQKHKKEEEQNTYICYESISPKFPGDEVRSSNLAQFVQTEYSMNNLHRAHGHSNKSSMVSQRELSPPKEKETERIPIFRMIWIAIAAVLNRAVNIDAYIENISFEFNSYTVQSRTRRKVFFLLFGRTKSSTIIRVSVLFLIEKSRKSSQISIILINYFLNFSLWSFQRKIFEKCVFSRENK